MAGMMRGGMGGMRGGAAMRGGERQANAKLPPKAREAFQAASKLKQAGKFSEASEAFHRLSTMATERHMPVMATRLAVQSAVCLIEGGDVAGGEAAAKRAIELGATVGDKRRAGRKLHQFFEKLRSNGHEAVAEELEGFARTTLGLKQLPGSESNTSVNRSQRRLLPKACGTCGAAVDSDDVDWNEDSTADCKLCGSNLF